MVIDGRRLFVTQIPINYTPTTDQVKKAEDLLEDITTRKNLNVLYDLSLVADNIEVLCQIDDSQNPISMLPLDDEEYLNFIN